MYCDTILYKMLSYDCLNVFWLLQHKIQQKMYPSSLLWWGKCGEKKAQGMECKQTQICRGVPLCHSISIGNEYNNEIFIGSELILVALLNSL